MWDAQEGLRLYPPGPFAVREATEDLVVCGHTVPRGSWVHVSAPCLFAFRFLTFRSWHGVASPCDVLPSMELVVESVTADNYPNACVI